MNEYTGVLGAFNCQGAGWCEVEKKNLIHDKQPGTITGIVRAKDVDYLQRVAGDGWNGDVIVYSHVQGTFPKTTSMRSKEDYIEQIIL